MEKTDEESRNMNKLAEQHQYNIPAKAESDHLLEAARADAGFEKMLKFKKGDYYQDGEEVALGTRFVAHVVGWNKMWIKFVKGGVAERRTFSVARGERPPERDELPDNDPADWPDGLDGRPQDPWVLQYLLPLESPVTGDLSMFVTSSYGGRRAISDLATTYSRKAARFPTGQPIIALRKVMMPTKKYGNVPRPYFEIEGWDDTREGIREVRTDNLKQEMDDEIPF